MDRPTHCHRITCFSRCPGCAACPCSNCLHLRALVAPSEPPADHLTTGVVPATHADAPVADAVWACLAGEGANDTAAEDFDAEGDVHELATADYDDPSDAAVALYGYDDVDRLLKATCRARRVA